MPIALRTYDNGHDTGITTEFKDSYSVPFGNIVDCVSQPFNATLFARVSYLYFVTHCK